MASTEPKAVAKPPKGPGLLRRLYNGDTDIDFVGRRKIWYGVSVLVVIASIGLGVAKGFNFGIEFAGGNQFEASVVDGVDLVEVRETVEEYGVEVASSQTAGSGDSARYIVRTEGLPTQQSNEIREAIAIMFYAQENGLEPGDVDPELVNVDEIAVSEVSSSWGSAVSEKALSALGVFLVLVTAYLWWRYDRKYAAGALVALVHDLILTAGVYSLVGFEVTPGTVVGILTILGYSLYDTVVVYDKVHENTREAMAGVRTTFSSAANSAINQTLMRSINTSIIGLLPVAGLLFVGAGVLGVGTLNDLALVLFVGMLAGTYSSLFLAVPAVVDLKYREPGVRAQARKVGERKTAERKSAKKETVAADASEERVTVSVGSGAPRPGARPVRKKKR
ncbi:protein translocase subunit SecF [Stackebrandtia soli]|uniref:protein translocase subunit SecF n=1 Tax=Stackebrandtia soli TaxID=1892856 RepID=UPI0039EAA026